MTTLTHDDLMQAIKRCAGRCVDLDTIAAVLKAACGGARDWLASKVPPAKRAEVIAALEQLEPSPAIVEEQKQFDAELAKWLEELKRQEVEVEP